MLRKNCLIKLSGDVLKSEVLLWAKPLTEKYFTVIIPGAGTDISKMLSSAGLPIGKFGPLGREIPCFEGKQLARDVMEKNQAKIQDNLAKMGIQATVVVPVIEVGTVLCHINGDQMVLAAYHGFDIIYVVTTKDRVAKKKEFFAPYKKIKVVGF